LKNRQECLYHLELIAGGGFFALAEDVAGGDGLLEIPAGGGGGEGGEEREVIVSNEISVWRGTESPPDRGDRAGMEEQAGIRLRGAMPG
jgi:hypothetical protein